MPLIQDLADGFVDLVLGSSCVGCGHPGRALCATCRDGLSVGAAVRWPTPMPAGLVSPYSTGGYDGALKAMVLAHKERRVLALARPLGLLLAHSVRAALREQATRTDLPVALVPVPSRPAAVRQRGHDPTLAMVRVAAAQLRREGQRVVVPRLLRVRPGVVDQAGLDAGQRSANLAGSMAAASAAVRRLGLRHPHAHVVLCDDVVTTGATLREGQRALEAAGIPVLAAASVAATARRHPPSNLRPGLSSPPATD